MAVYLDSSAIVKLVVREAESAALRRFIDGERPWVTSALARTEVLRAVQPGGTLVFDRAQVVLEAMAEVVVTRNVLDHAGRLDPKVSLRSLDAIHIASALRVQHLVGSVVTYDHRMGTAAEAMGLVVVAPS
ncbi:MAG: type II toxin-antitoxin system VapC family toxin [Acidimicrobiia bacterium]|nr:type II toxin-antitoxin system VapC family toxin [Acidimicrobiia bacterium]